MFVYHRTIRVRDTDATGALYFANQLQIALEAFEEFLTNRKFSIGEIVRKNQFFLPIVHAEGDFFAPIALGDHIEVHLSFSKVGTRSVTHSSTLLKQGCNMGTTSIVHAVYCPNKQKTIPIPPKLKTLIMEEIEKT